MKNFLKRLNFVWLNGARDARKFLTRHPYWRLSRIHHRVRDTLATGRHTTKPKESIMKTILLAAAAATALTFGAAANAATDPMVGGAAMYDSKDIIDNAVNSKDHTTLVTAVKAAGLVETLKGAGPFTVFAPTNEAFAALPAGTVETLVKPENKATLTKILTYHVVSGRLSSKDLDAQVKAGGGSAMLTTVAGGALTVKGHGKELTITDEKGNTAAITIADVFQSNGVIQVVDKVLMPK
jgi:uncharacterized surface protein with fasciclin (FAS1) repeats